MQRWVASLAVSQGPGLEVIFIRFNSYNAEMAREWDSSKQQEGPWQSHTSVAGKKGGSFNQEGYQAGSSEMSGKRVR